jgi:hypothetical protein
LPIDSGLGRKVKISRVTIRFLDSREPKVGPNSTLLDPLKWRSDVAWGTTTAWFSGVKSITIPQTWGFDAQVSIQAEPGYRCEILGISPEVVAGE